MNIRSLIVVALVAVCGGAHAREPVLFWNQYRGGAGDGFVDRFVPSEWSETKGVAWKTAIHGRAWSSPVVWENTIYLTTATKDGKKLSVLFVDAKTGKVTLDRVVFEVDEPNFCHPTNTYASPTPFVEQDRLYVHFGAYGTACLDRKTGKTLWERRDFACDDFRGPGSSPIVDEERLYVHFDGVDLQYVVALNKETGETVWKTNRDIDYGTDNPDRKKAYGTPTLIEVKGETQLVCPSAAATIAYAPATGKELWRVQHGGMNAAARPLYKKELLYVAAGSGERSLLALRPTGKGLLGDDHIVWSTGKGVPKRSSQVWAHGLLIMTDDGGVASCVDAATGKLHQRIRLGGDFWASPIVAGGKAYFCSKSGKCVVVSADKQFKVLAENQLDAPIVASPAAVGNSLLIRTETHLYRIGK